MRKLKVLVACEYSGAVRDAFNAAGHYAMSCDLLPCDSITPGHHFRGDVFDLFPMVDGKRQNINEFDLMVAHPPCTRLCVSGARWFKFYEKEQAEALDFVRELMALPVEMIAIENPISVISTRIRKPDQIIQPWQFGHGETKATCLWLKNLPNLVPTNIVAGREQRIHKMGPSKDRWKLRSATYSGIAAAMAQQWGSVSPWFIRRTDLIDLKKGA